MVKSDFRKYHIEKLQNDDESIKYLEIALQEFENDGDSEVFLMALRDVAEAKGGMAKLAHNTKLGRTSLYKTLSTRGNPKINTIGSILKGLGIRIRLEPIRHNSRV